MHISRTSVNATQDGFWHPQISTVACVPKHAGFMSQNPEADATVQRKFISHFSASTVSLIPTLIYSIGFIYLGFILSIECQ